MEIYHFLSLLIILLSFSKIKNESYIFNKFSDLKCDKSNYIETFKANTCGKKELESSLYFSFVLQDTKKKSHSIQCSIEIPTSLRNLQGSNNQIESNYPNQILFSNDINQGNDAVINIKGKTILETYINDNNNKSFYNNKSTDFLDNNTNYVSDEIVDNNDYNMSDTINTINESNYFKSTYLIDDEVNHFISSIPNKDNSTNSIEDLKINDQIDKSTDIIIKTKTTQIQKNEDRETEEIKKEVEKYSLYCYKTICQFEENIREEFEIKIEPNIYKIDINSGDSEIQATFNEQQTYNIKKCYLIKNIFKQVLKYRTNDSQKKITFLFVAKILSKIEKNEQIIVSVELKKKEKTIRILENEKKNSTCYSMYDAEPVEGEEVLVSYSCEVNNIEKPSQYSGIVFAYSADVDEISDDPNLQDPAITDELIKDRKVQDNSIVTFNSESIDSTECEKNGKFEIKGKLNGKIDETLYLVLYLYLNGNTLENASCSVPKASWKQISISCEVKNNFRKSKISIPSHIIRNLETNETIINIASVNSEVESTCIIEPELTDSIETDIEPTTVPDTTIIQDIISTELIFRQISHLEIDSSSNKIKLNLICFTVNNLHKNSYLTVVMKLIKINADNEEKNATCFLNNDINANINYLNPLSLDCEINDINDITKVNDIQIISSPLIKNIPNENSNFTILTYTKMTDEQIEKGKLTDYSKEENNIPPMLSNLLINTESCEQDGTFIINSFIDTKIEKILFFYLELDNPIIKVRCQIPLTEANTRVNIQCNTINEFYNSKIEIDSKIVYDIKYNELLYINRTVSNDIANCKSNKELKMVEALKKLDAIYSFRQVSKFKKEDNKYKFFLATFIKEKIDKSMKLNMQVEIKREINTKNIDGENKRKLSDKEIKNVECSPTMITAINNAVGVGAAGWDCTTEESSIDDAIGLDLINSEDISGIPPNNSALIDPAQTDLLIQSGEVKDYSIEENLNELLPIFNILSLNFSFCKENGTFNFEGDISATTFKDVIFNLSLTYPEAIFACRLPRTFKGEKAVIECYNRDNFENDPVLVEETVIRDGLNEYVILRNSTSGESYVTCSTSESKIKEQKYDDDINIISKTMKNSKTGGIGVGGIIAISVVGGLVLVAIIVLIVIIKNKYKKKTLFNNDQKVISTTMSSFGSSSSPSFY